MEIIPAILPKNYEDLKNKIALFRGHVSIMQIDICDGSAVPNKGWPFFEDDQHFRKIINEKEGMPFWEDIDFEFDLMVADAVENFDLYAKLGAKRIIFHIDTVGNLGDFKNFLEGLDEYVLEAIEIGLAVNVDFDLGKVAPLVNNVDFIQCMGIEKVGFQGQVFSPKIIENVKALRERFPDLVISVDGGVNFDTAPLLAEAGVSRLVIGSAILNSTDIIGTIEEFEKLL